MKLKTTPQMVATLRNHTGVPLSTQQPISTNGNNLRSTSQGAQSNLLRHQ